MALASLHTFLSKLGNPRESWALRFLEFECNHTRACTAKTVVSGQFQTSPINATLQHPAVCTEVSYLMMSWPLNREILQATDEQATRKNSRRAYQMIIEEIIGQEIAAAAPIGLRRVPKCNREIMAWLCLEPATSRWERSATTAQIRGICVLLKWRLVAKPTSRSKIGSTRVWPSRPCCSAATPIPLPGCWVYNILRTGLWWFFFYLN